MRLLAQCLYLKKDNRVSDFIDSVKDSNMDAVIDKLLLIKGLYSSNFDNYPDWLEDNGQDRRGVLACYYGHLMMWMKAFTYYDDYDAFAFFEDDCRFDLDACERFKLAFSELPTNWDLFYIGGQHLIPNRPYPTKFSNNLYLANNVNRTHAYLVNKKALGKLINHFTSDTTWGSRFRNTKSGCHESSFDYELGRLAEDKIMNVYSIRNNKRDSTNLMLNDWICYQCAGVSGTTFKKVSDNRFELVPALLNKEVKYNVQDLSFCIEYVI